MRIIAPPMRTREAIAATAIPAICALVSPPTEATVAVSVGPGEDAVAVGKEDEEVGSRLLDCEVGEFAIEVKLSEVVTEVEPSELLVSVWLVGADDRTADTESVLCVAVAWLVWALQIS
jgi:hypothetical protein